MKVHLDANLTDLRTSNMCMIPSQIMIILRKWLRSSCCQQGPTIKTRIIPYEIVAAFIKSLKIHNVLNGINENP